MTRRTRPHVERLEAISFSVNRVSGSMRDLLLIVSGGMALCVGAVVYALTDDWATTAGGAGVGGALGIVYVTTLAWDLARTALVSSRDAGDDGWNFARTGRNQLSALPVVTDERGREVDRWTPVQYTEYMTAVLDEDDDTGFNQRDAAAFGHDRDRFNALVAWVHARGWYRYSNGVDNRNGGSWIASPATILATTPDDGNG